MSESLSSFVSPFLDWNGRIDVKLQHLPHFEQAEKIQFITFRLFDSLPKEKLDELKAMKEEINKAMSTREYVDKQAKYNTRSLEKVDEWLQQGYGMCCLRDYDIRQVIVDAFQFVADKRCIIYGYVIMPNHVHVLLRPLHGETWSAVIGSVRRHSAKLINKMLNRTGNLWQIEPFDTCLRDKQHFCRCLGYIESNPELLSEGEYSLYFNHDEVSKILSLY